jgi:hypothetical protein
MSLSPSVRKRYLLCPVYILNLSNRKAYPLVCTITHKPVTAYLVYELAPSVSTTISLAIPTHLFLLLNVTPFRSNKPVSVILTDLCFYLFYHLTYSSFPRLYLWLINNYYVLTSLSIQKPTPCQAIYTTQSKPILDLGYLSHLLVDLLDLNLLSVNAYPRITTKAYSYSG